MFLYQGEKVDSGNIRETFLVNQLSYNQTVEFSEVSDFFVNDKYTIECGGKSKTGEQIKDLEYAFVAADGIETGAGSKIPLWLFGFLYRGVSPSEIGRSRLKIIISIFTQYNIIMYAKIRKLFYF